MNSVRSTLVLAISATMLLPPGWSSQANAVDLFDRFKVRKPATAPDPGVDRLTREIDWIERQIETYGSVVPKHPDIWGEARLTRHRQEYDIEMSRELGTFEETLNASIRRSDQALSAFALSLGFNASPSGPLPGAGADSAAGSKADSTTNIFQLLPDPNAPGQDFVSRTKPGELPLGKIGFGKEPQLSIEPVTKLAQKSRYLYFLNELRRINEGDDTADAPGYGMYLARIPVSVLPGKRTYRGYGAEITFTAEPYLSPELLPQAFRTWVINDVTNQFALPILKILEDPCVLKEAYRGALRTRDPEFCALRDACPDQILNCSEDSGYKEPKCKDDRDAVEHDGLKRGGAEIIPDPQLDDTYAENTDRYMMPTKDRQGFEALTRRTDLVPAQTDASWKNGRLAFPNSQLLDVYGIKTVSVVAVGANRSLQPRIKMRCAHVADVQAYLREELEAAYRFLSHPDIQQLWTHCSPELVAAIRQRRRWLHRPVYNDLKQLEKRDKCKSNDETAKLALDQQEYLAELQSEFFNDARRIAPRSWYTETLSLAWTIIVHSALLNARLIDEMNETAAEKGCGCGIAPGFWPDFYLPQPSPEARATFSEFVGCRWPIQIFTLDPITDEQNVAEAFSSRREMQLAIAVAVANGEMRANAAMEFLRRLETDIETIGLNRTTVGFVHGERTFGWRFYPRVQSPPTRGNIAAFCETVCGGPTSDQNFRSRALSPGMRECIAMIMMPSFVPYVTFNSRSNWFGLTNPRKKEWTIHEALKLGQAHQSVLASLGRSAGAPCYRPEDVASLYGIVKQMENRLPIQTEVVQFPFESSLSGTEILNDGATSLGPQLYGWYGCPGVLCAKGSTCHCPDGGYELGGTNQCNDTCGGTTMFLVGDGFSVHDTKVTAGGRCVPFVLMSRQVMRVTIPHKVNVTEIGEGACAMPCVEVHVATPYGVSNYMHIPVVNRSCTGDPNDNPCPPTPTPAASTSAKTDDAKTDSKTSTTSPSGGAAPSGTSSTTASTGIEWKKAPAAVLSIFPYPHVANWHEKLGCMDVVFHHCPEPEKGKDFFTIEAKRGFGFDVGRAYILVQLAVKNDTSDKPRVLKKTTTPIPVTLTKDKTYTVKMQALINALEVALEDSHGEGLLATDSPTEITGATYLKVDGWPALKLDNEIKLTVKEVREPCVVRLPPTEGPNTGPMLPGSGTSLRFEQGVFPVHNAGLIEPSFKR